MNENYNSERFSTLSLGDRDPAAQERIEIMTSMLRQVAAGPIVDVGCMDGVVSGMLRDATGYPVFGVDNSDTALEKAKASGRCERVFRVSLGEERIPLADGEAHSVFAGEVLEHVFRTEDLLRELNRIVTPGGYLVLSTPNLASWFNRAFVLLGQQPLFSETGVETSNGGNWLTKPSFPAGHIRAFTASSLRDILGKTGWSVVTLRGCSVLGNKLRPLDRQVARLFPSLASDLIALCVKRPA